MKVLFATFFVVVLSTQTLLAEKPNILWITAEDLSQDLGVYGNQILKTPVLDTLAAEGVVFENMFTTAGVCAPSRTALATGVFQTSLGAFHMRYPDELKPHLTDGIVPHYELFQQAGYVTAQIRDDHGTAKKDWCFAESKAWEEDYKSIQELASSRKPFFAVVNIKLTHRPFVEDAENPVSPDSLDLPPYYPDTQVAREDWADYYETIQQLDARVGALLDDLTSTGLMKNTVVFFFSDHGRPMPRAKNSLYDSGTRIPMIVKFANGMKLPDEYLPNSTDNRLLSSVDLIATSLAIAGINLPEWMQGRPFYFGTEGFERPYIFSSLDRIGGTEFKSRSVRTKNHRLIMNFNYGYSTNEASTAYRKAMHPVYHVLNEIRASELTPAQRMVVDPLPRIELYDLQADPFETRNLAGLEEYRQTEQELVSKLLNWILEIQDHGMLTDSDEIKQSFADYKRESHVKHAKKIKNLRDSVRESLMAEGILVRE